MVKKDRGHVDKAGFIEEMGISFEEMGLPRMAGRILGQLLICVPPHQSARELAQVVGASKGSISTTVRFLAQVGLVERIGVPGERSTFFRVRPESFSEHVTARLTRISSFRQLAEKGLMLLEKEPTEHRRRLEEMRDLYAFFERELPALIQRFNESHKGAKGCK